MRFEGHWGNGVASWRHLNVDVMACSARARAGTVAASSATLRLGCILLRRLNRWLLGNWAIAQIR